MTVLRLACALGMMAYAASASAQDVSDDVLLPPEVIAPVSEAPFAAPVTTSVDLPLRDAPAPTYLDLEVAMRADAHSFDLVNFVSASRSIVTGLLEVYCAAGLLIPPAEGSYEVLDVVLGVGCLIGTATLFTMGIRKLRHPSESERALVSLDEFYRLRRLGELDPAAVGRFERGLADAAARGRRRRIVNIVFGALNLVATATIAGLAGRGRIASNTGTSIATGTGILGVLGLSAAWMRSPSENAWSRYRTQPLGE